MPLNSVSENTSGCWEVPITNSVIVFRAASLLHGTQWIFLSAKELSEVREKHLDFIISSELWLIWL